MDPQKLSQLDPKLRDAYQRVMGTPIPQPQVAPVQAQTPTPPVLTPDPTPVPTPDPEPEPTPTSTPTIEKPPVAPPPPAAEPNPVSEPTPTIPPVAPNIPTSEPSIPQQPPVQASNFVQMNSEVAAAPSSPNFSAPIATQTMTLKKKHGMMMPILFGIVGLVFIVIYTLFWAKIFNFKLPFLP